MKWLCCECGKKMTNKAVYYWLDAVDRMRPVCKECFKQLSGKTDEEMKELDNEA